jgi:endonuclease-3 related protein
VPEFLGISRVFPVFRAANAFLDLPGCDSYRALEMSLSTALPQIVTPSPGLPSRRESRANGEANGQPGPCSHSIQPGNSPLSAYFAALFAAHGPQHWWPGRSRFEIIVGAILTQNTSWRNVRHAIGNLRARKLLSPLAMQKVRASRLSASIRPAGYFRQKTQTLKTFVDFLFSSHRGSLDRLFATPTDVLRVQLLGLRGIGPETADSILLYAGKHPVFVVDAYARRILERHGLADPRAKYEQLRATFESALPRDRRLLNEFHALIVQTGKLHCRKSKPLCTTCPLAKFLPAAGGSRDASRVSPCAPR